jgi:pyruvate kinase
MSSIAREAEPHVCTGDVGRILEAEKSSGDISTDDLISLSIYMSVVTLNPVALVTPTMSGATSRRVSRFRLPVWIIGVSSSEKTCQDLQFTFGVFPVREKVRPESWERYACEWLGRHGLTEHLALLTQGSGYRRAGSTNNIEVIDLGNPPLGKPVW